MANMSQIIAEAEFQKMIQDSPKMQTRPAPNDEQHRTFQLACHHRDLNDRYKNYLREFEGCLNAFADVLAIVREETPTEG